MPLFGFAQISSQFSGAQNPSSSAQGNFVFQSPFGEQTFGKFVCRAIIFLKDTLLPPIAVFMMLVAGFLFMTSGGDPGKAKRARQALLFSLAGVALLVLAPGIVALIGSVFGGTLTAPSCTAATFSTTTLTDALLSLVNWFSWLVAVTAVVMGLYSGFLYLTTRGDPQRVRQATKTLSFTIIGIAVAIISFSVIAVVKTILGV